MLNITLPESGQEMELKSLTRGQIKELKQLLKDNPDMPLMDYWEKAIEMACKNSKVDLKIADDMPGADFAFLARQILAYSTGGPDAVKN